jgi:hypothetical protein
MSLRSTFLLIIISTTFFPGCRKIIPAPYIDSIPGIYKVTGTISGYYDTSVYTKYIDTTVVISKVDSRTIQISAPVCWDFDGVNCVLPYLNTNYNAIVFSNYQQPDPRSPATVSGSELRFFYTPPLDSISYFSQTNCASRVTTNFSGIKVH